MDLFNSYRDPFLYGEEEEEGEVGGIADDDDPKKPDPDEDEDSVLKDAPEEFQEESSWNER